MSTARAWQVLVATGVVAGAFAMQKDWAVPVDRAQVPVPSLAGPASPVTDVSPAREEIPADVDTTGLLQPSNEDVAPGSEEN